MREIDKLAWLCVKDKRLLVARSYGKEAYYIPGGKREAGESDEVALSREIEEELSVKLVPASIAYVETFSAQADGKPAGVMVKITCYRADFRGGIQPSAEIETVDWVRYADKARCSTVTKIIMVVLTKEESLLIGERFYVENELARLMAGPSFSKFVKF